MMTIEVPVDIEMTGEMIEIGTTMIETNAAIEIETETETMMTMTAATLGRATTTCGT